MRTVATPGATFGSLVREWLRIAGGLCASWRYASRSNAFRSEPSAPLRDLIEALAPLGMPDVLGPRSSCRMKAGICNNNLLGTKDPSLGTSGYS